MYCITDFCRVCLTTEKSLTDIVQTETQTDSLVNKLKLCVSEVEWSTNNTILMCIECIEKLNNAYDFKNQCLQSTKVFENYIQEGNKSGNTESNNMVSGITINTNIKDVSRNLKENYISQSHLDQTQPKSIFSQLPNIIITPNNTFQNIFFNVIPPAVKYRSNQEQNSNSKDTNHNVFLNINTLHKIIPISPTNPDTPTPKLLEDVNISKILTESKSEELSVEIDPMCFECSSEDDTQTLSENSTDKDWEDLISSNKIHPDNLKQELDITNDNLVSLPVNKFVPIRPKLNSSGSHLFPELQQNGIEFFNVDHFMADKQQIKYVVCEECGHACETIKSLHLHIKQLHKGNFPYKCNQCSSVYALLSQFELHTRKHDLQKSDLVEMITLDNLSQQNESTATPPTDPNIDAVENFEEGEINADLEYKCDLCTYSFNNTQALSQHKIKKHQTRRKYFVKGMKNAKCHICNREFSTQSYLQLHIKLHFRKNDYRLKVFNKDRYLLEKQSDKSNNSNNSKTETICDKTVESKKIEESICSENAPEDSISDQTGHGIKIKINLKNMKTAPDQKVSIKAETESNNISDSTEEKVTPMEVDQHRDKKVPAENRILSQINDYTQNSTNANSEESAIIKEEGSPDMQVPPISTAVINGKQQCTFCLKLYRRKHDLKRHLNNIHLKAIQYVCHLCKSPFYEAFQLTRHLRQHNGFVRCGVCLKEYSILRDLKLHLTAAHDSSALCQCGTCGQSFQRIKYLREHMHEHDKSIIYKCHICTDSFKESRDLSRHLVEHSGMYACNICRTTFSAEQELNNHSKCHSDDPTNERKYKCDICPSKFKKKRYLMAHVKKTHSKKNDVLSTTIEINCKSA
ncbi:hypothetical protein FQA39_LY09652 [Lamprigera yunnana]|nr:hypothetical protein FQA39_LY09652 [Lamprigera yunnana]